MLNRRYHPDALGELIAAALYLDKQQQGYGDEMIDEVEAKLTQIRKAPQQWPLTLAGCRKANTRRFKYQVIYRVDPIDGVIVYAVKHPSRRPGYWVNRVNTP